MTSPSPEAFNCPSCGAPVDPEAGRCAYCRCRLTSVSCPRCFKPLAPAAAFCGACGTSRTRVDGDTHRTRCPACQGGMSWAHVGTTDLLECRACDGTWIEAPAFERICADRESQAAVLHTDSSSRPTAAPDARIRYRPCPTCGALMNRVNFGRLSGAIVDVCKGHGTFLDRGELHQIVTFIISGGVDRARAAERERLEEEGRRLRQLERLQGRTNPESSSRWSDDALQRLLRSLR